MVRGSSFLLGSTNKIIQKEELLKIIMYSLYLPFEQLVSLFLLINETFSLVDTYKVA